MNFRIFSWPGAIRAAVLTHIASRGLSNYHGKKLVST